MLTDKVYIDLIKSTIADINQNTKMADKNQLWEFTKCQIRTYTIDHSIQRSKKLKEQEIQLQEELKRIEKSIDSDTKSDSPEYYDYLKTKGEWEKIVKRITNGIILRSKAQWVEEGEKITKYFINLEKRNFDRKYIKN